MPIETRTSVTHEIVILVPTQELLRQYLGDRFDPNHKFQVDVNQNHLRIVQFDRQESTSDVEPPSAVKEEKTDEI